MQKKFTSTQIATAYQKACIAELQALKPGNVHMFADGHGMTIHDFIKSAEASAEMMAQADLTLGERIYLSVQATQKAVGLNTNLGIIILCAPLIQTALHLAHSDDNHDTNDIFETKRHTTEQLITQNLTNLYRHISINDAQLTAKAILLAKPAGLGNVVEHDVHTAQTLNLFELMRVAEHRDLIAWQYTHEFADILQYGLARYLHAFSKWQNVAWATTAMYLGFLARKPDSHIARKYDVQTAHLVMLEAQDIEAEYWQVDNPKLVQKKLLAWDVSLKARGLNPGTSADLTVATLFVWFLE